MTTTTPYRSYTAIYKPLTGRHDVLIGLDPDTVASGIAVRADKNLMLTRQDFPTLIKTLERLYGEHGNKMKVRVSAGWLNKPASFHAAKNIGTASRIGVKVGRNHQVGLCIVEWCKHLGIEVEEVQPTTRKWTVEMLKAATGIQVLKGESELIDSAVLVL